MGRVLRVACTLVVACAVAMVGTPSGAQEPPATTLTVTPAADLVDGDVVGLSGTGFAPSAAVYFCQGVVDEPVGPEDCGVSFQSAPANEVGEFSASYTVRRFMAVSGTGAVIDCAQPSAPCFIGASSFLSGGQTAFAPLTFAPQPALSVTVTPDADLVHGDVVEVQGTSFPPSTDVSICQTPPGDIAFCSSPVTIEVDASGEFSGNYTVQRLIGGFGPNQIDCAAPSSGCVLRVGVNGADVAQVPLAFAPQPGVPPISGTVTDPGGAPRAGVDVWAYTPTDSWVGALRTVTDAQGSYTLTEAQIGVEYRVLFRTPSGSALASEWYDDAPSRHDATPFTLADGQFVEADAQLDQAGSLSGTVTDPSGDPVAGARVRAYQPEERLVATYQTTTGPDGTYTVGNIRPGDLRVSFTPPAGSGLATEWFDDVAARRDATAITVDAGQTVADVDAQLAAAP